MEPVATIEELPGQPFAPAGQNHAMRWMGVWIALLAGVVGFAAMGRPGEGPDTARGAGPDGSPPATRRPAVELTAPTEGEVAERGFVDVAGSVTGGTMRMLEIRVELGALVLGLRTVPTSPAGTFAARVRAVAPPGSARVPASVVVADATAPSAILSERRITFGGPAAATWHAHSTGRGTLLAGIAPDWPTKVDVTVRASHDGLPVGASAPGGLVANGAIREPALVPALRAFGLQVWSLLVPVWGNRLDVRISWSDAASNRRGSRYETVSNDDTGDPSDYRCTTRARTGR